MHHRSLDSCPLNVISSMKQPSTSPRLLFAMLSLCRLQTDAGLTFLPRQFLQLGTRTTQVVPRLLDIWGLKSLSVCNLKNISSPSCPVSNITCILRIRVTPRSPRSMATLLTTLTLTGFMLGARPHPLLSSSPIPIATFSILSNLVIPLPAILVSKIFSAASPSKSRHYI